MAVKKTSLRPSTFLKGKKAAQKIFKNLAPDLEEKELLTEGNQLIFEILCKELGLYFTIDVPDHQMVIKGQNESKVINPIIRERRNILTNALGLAKQFGLTPKGLHELGKLMQEEKEVNDPLADMLAKRRKLKAV